MTSVELPARSRIAIRVIFGVLVAVLLLAVGEVGFRVLEYFGPRSFVFRQYDPFLGVSLIPNASGIHRHCFDGYVSVNEFGMRDAPRQIQKPDGTFRIGLFGDSIVEGVHVYPDQVASQRLEVLLNRKICHGRCEVLNFGVGGFGTLQEWRRYQRDGRPFNLDLVALLFFGNDISNNLPGSESFDENLYSTPYVTVNADGSETIHEPEKPASYDVLLFLNRYSSMFRFIYKLYFHLIYPKLHLASDETPKFDLRNGVTMPVDLLAPTSARGNAGWSVTGRLLDNFVEEVRKDGADFVLFYSGYEIPDPTDRDHAVAAEFEESSGSKVDFHMATNWFKRYSQRTGVPVFAWGTFADKYVADHGLEDIGIGYSCDQHLNPEGHAVLADYMFRSLAPIVRRGLAQEESSR